MNFEKSICPVPQEQRPINEYLLLKESFGFSWTAKDNIEYLTNSIKMYLVTLGLCFLLFNSNSDSLLNNVSYSILGSTIILFIVYMRIYLGWNYVYTRLMQSTVAYEESGWYDGQIWVKTPEILIKDKLAGQYAVKPIVTTLQKTLFTFLLLIGISTYLIVTSN
jgi:hypothetical protein